MSRKPINEKAMTPAERQRRRRARLRAENPLSKPGRPRHKWVETERADQADRLLSLIGASPSRRRAERRHYVAKVYQGIARDVLGICKGLNSYSPEAEERYKRLNKKTILEALGRHGMYALLNFGADAAEVMRYWADDLIKEGDELSAESVVQFFRAIRMMRGSDAVY